MRAAHREERAGGPLPGPITSTEGSGWAPLLDGALRERALTVAEEIADAVERATVPGHGAGIAGGAAGFALLNAYLAKQNGSSEAAQRAVIWLGRAIDELGSMRDASLYAGVSGVGWAAEHVSRLLEIDDPDPDGAVEQALLGVVASPPWRSFFDLVTGLAGYGVYALERLPRPGARECLECVVQRLAEIAERGDDGVAWRTPPRLLPVHRREETPDGRYDLGVAHGAPGVIAVTAAAAAAGVATDQAARLARDGAAWLLAQRLDDAEGSCFAYWLAPGREPRPARLAWCYGDPGAAAALLVAARALGDAELEREALATARRAASRSPEAAEATDAGLSHGAAGLGHLFNRVHQATGDARLGAAARRWLERALDMRSPDGDGFGGYRPDATLQELGQDGSGFLDGATGIALALLAAASETEPGWDRLLAISARA